MKVFPDGFIRSHHSKIEIICRFVEAFIIVGGLLFSSWLHNFPWNPHFSFFALASIGLFYLFARKYDLYLSWRIASVWKECKVIVKSWLLIMLILLALVLFMNLTGEHFRRVFLSWFLFGLIVLPLWRGGLRITIRQMRLKGRNRKTLAIAGSGDLGKRVASSILNNPWTGLEISGIYDDLKPKGMTLGFYFDIHVEGNLDDLVKKAQSGSLDYVCIALPLGAEKRIINLIEKLSKTVAAVYIVPNLLMYDFLKSKIIQLDDVPLVNIVENPLHGKVNWTTRFSHVVKKAFDLTFSLFIVLAFSPFILLVSMLILLFEGPPIIYRSIRYISTNKKIYILKFRSMIKNATDPAYKLKERFMRDGYLDIPLNCEVYTPIGRLLEKTQFVEILQLFNILFDGMSLIGNRPLPLDNLGILKKNQGWELRFDSPAGITGISQVIGKLNLTPKERLELETLYSTVYKNGKILRCDLMIIFYTIRLILGKKETSLNEAKDLLKKCLK